MNELGLVEWIVRSASRARNVRVGPGDDAAVIACDARRDLVFTIDEVVEGTHFRLTGAGLGPRATGRDVGVKALLAAASDLAAMGADPLAAVAAAALPKGAACLPSGKAARLGRTICLGLRDAARRIGCPLVGGNVTGTSGPVTVTVACIGRVPRGRAFLRKGARPGDALFVTGQLGGSALGRHLRPCPRLAEAKRLRELGGVRAMMDVSDGLALDLSRLARASGVGAVLDLDAVPVSAAARRLARSTGRSPQEHALGDGEDYELLFALDRASAAKIERLWRLPTRVTRIGEIVPRAKGLAVREGGRTRRLRPAGYVHL